MEKLSSLKRGGYELTSDESGVVSGPPCMKLADTTPLLLDDLALAQMDNEELDRALGLLLIDVINQLVHVAVRLRKEANAAALPLLKSGALVCSAGHRFGADGGIEHA